MKKVHCTFLAIVLIISLCINGVLPVKAGEITEYGEAVPVYLTSPAFQKELAVSGVETNSTSMVSIILGSSKKSAYLIKTLLKSEQTRIDIVLVFDENGVRQNVSSDDFYAGSAKGSGSGTVHPYKWFNLTATGTYTTVYVNWHLAELHQPSNVSFYYNPYSPGTISSFSTTVVFTTGGVEYSLLTHTVPAGGNPYSYAISISRNNPQTNTVYRQYGSFSTNYGIDVSCGGYFYGEHINVSGTCNGNSYEDGFSF